MGLKVFTAGGTVDPNTTDRIV